MPVRADLVYTIQDQEDWERLLNQSEEMCLVIDCYQDWCGPCECLEPSYKRWWLETEECDERMKFLRANLKLFADQIKDILPADSNIDVDKNGSMPFFLIVRFKQSVATIKGVNTPVMSQMINLNLPPLKKKDE